MAETFYSVLGVDTDADADAIRDAYRAQVKETHPDVSDDADAATTFKRLTAARDVLVDEKSRRRYDRVGHRTYVRDHLDSPAWSVDEAGAVGRSAGTRSTGSGGPDSSGSEGRGPGTADSEGRGTGTADSDATDDGGSGAGTDVGGRDGRDTGDGSTAENYQRYRSSRADAATDGTAAGDRTSRSERRDTGDHGTWSTERGQDWAFSGSSSSTSTATGGHSTDPRDRARADGWQAAHAATGTYTPTGHEPTATTGDEGVGSLRAALLEIGPWLAFHFVFLISAFVTIWLVMSWIPSVPMLFVSLLLLGATVFFSILHMVSQVYS